MNHSDQPSLTLQPIGFVRTGNKAKFDAPPQPDPEASEVNEIELLPGNQFDLALSDLEGFEKIWLIWWFDRNTTWRPTVLPPRGPSKRRGVFSTRSPHRPNPIGLTCVSLVSITGRTLKVGPLDLVDGTPILDIKPYLRTVDCFPDASIGWLEQVEESEREPPRFQIELTQGAALRLAWLKENWGIDFTERAYEILRRDPTPHRTRRVLQMEQNRFRIACGAWRMFYRIELDRVVVESVEKGYSDETLASHPEDIMLHRDAQIAFAKWTRSLADTET